MRRALRRTALAALALAVLALAGCDDERKPFPLLTVLLRGDGRYQIDATTYDRAGFDREVSRLADATRRQITNDARAYVRVKADPGVPYDRVQRTVSRLVQAGFNNIQTAGN